MELFEAVNNRRAIRKYKEGPSEEQLSRILDAARVAPSALNEQPWVFVVIDDMAKRERLESVYRDTRKKLGLYEQDTSFLVTATPVVVCYEKDKPFPEVSTALACENMWLTATALGLGANMLRAPLGTEEARAAIRQLLAVPESHGILCIMVFGVPDESPDKEKRQLREIVKHDRF